MYPSYRLKKVHSSDCIQCQGIEDTTEHLLTCSKSTEVSSPLLACIRNYFPNISNQDIVILNIPTQESLDLPISWLLASCLSYIWKERVQGKQASLQACRAELISSLAVIRSTKWKHFSLHNSATLLEAMINLHFNL